MDDATKAEIVAAQRRFAEAYEHYMKMRTESDSAHERVRLFEIGMHEVRERSQEVDRLLFEANRMLDQARYELNLLGDYAPRYSLDWALETKSQ